MGIKLNGQNSNKNINDLTRLGLEGNVKTLIDIHCYGGDTNKIPKTQCTCYKTIFHFNVKGYLIEEIYFNPDDSMSSKYIYKYDKNDVKIENAYYKPDGSMSVKETYKYDDNGNKVEWNRYFSNDSLISKDTYKYDNQGNLTEWNRFLPNSKLDFKSVSNYNEKGYIIETTCYDSDGSLSFKDIFKYDEKGNTIENIRTQFLDTNYISKNSYLYDKNGKMIEWTISEDDLTTKEIYKYKYDKIGNWIKKSCFFEERDISLDTTYRKFEYY